jgi:hypothetical protein
MLANRDFYEEFLTSLIQHKVDHLIVGGFAVNLYGFSRVTEDLDIWVNPEPQNFNRLKAAIFELGFQEETQRLCLSNYKLYLNPKPNEVPGFSLL